MTGSFLQNDLDIFLNTSDFAQTGTLTPQPSGTGKTVEGIFDNESYTYDASRDELINTTPTFICQSVEISGTKLNDKLETNSSTYYIMKIEPDGTGISKLYLSKGRIT